MPYLVTLTAELDGAIPPSMDHLHALVSTWIEGDAALEAHRANIKGFRVGLMGWDPSGVTQIRLGLVDDDLLPLLCRKVERVGPIRLGRQRGQLARDARGQVIAELTHRSWTDLLDAAVPESGFRFRFRSPTAFRSGRTVVPVPNPGSIFGHLRRRWSEFAPKDLTPYIDFRSCGLELVEFDGGALQHRTRGSEVPGFVGDVRIEAHGTDREHRTLSALAGLTPFSGIGANTTVGMGDAIHVAELAAV